MWLKNPLSQMKFQFKTPRIYHTIRVAAGKNPKTRWELYEKQSLS